MILEEWNTEDAIAFAREERREDGREEGINYPTYCVVGKPGTHVFHATKKW